MTDAIHRILIGQALTARQLAIGGMFVLVWFTIDLVQWLDWLIGKFQ